MRRYTSPITSTPDSSIAIILFAKFVRKLIFVILRYYGGSFGMDRLKAL